jgi:hypothetical protein
MPFDLNLKKYNKSIPRSFKPIPPQVWNKWKTEYENRINEFEKKFPNGKFKGIKLKFDYRSILFEKSTISDLYETEGVKDDDYVVFKFISKKGPENSDLRITPCIMEKNSYMVKVNSNKIGHKSKGKIDSSIPKGYSSSNYEERLVKLKSLIEFNKDVQGIAHTVSEFKTWFEYQNEMIEFAVIFLFDDSNHFNEIKPQTRKMSLGFINAVKIENSVKPSRFLNFELFDQGQACCPPAN